MVVVRLRGKRMVHLLGERSAGGNSDLPLAPLGRGVGGEGRALHPLPPTPSPQGGGGRKKRTALSRRSPPGDFGPLPPARSRTPPAAPPSPRRSAPGP